MTGSSNIHVAPHFALTQDGSQAVLDAAEALARTLGLVLSIAIVDHGGHLLLFRRMDGVHLGTIDVAIGKARCAVEFRRSTRAFAEALATGAIALTTLAGIIPFAGGVPLVVKETIVGAIGVSGAAPDQDDQIANAGVKALHPGRAVFE